ncbi:proline hydroxylase [Novosphingobium sp. Rr 2-17]|uniref:2OG-Fe(II) oxygenase n=1 Tax=Novosphingobium sp. Rr 2-17 TaxID=555793 RepID=UPI0002699893|nr:2OG-Fe(II) oxygenase family protein [Novosphingobium sp. Rr 2-17]EIZ78770.1 proline hydroxylase [Novosphingobium sp. Rr 2-17]
MSPPAFTLNPALDADRLRDDYRRLGRVRIHDFLVGDGPDRLLADLSERGDWRQVLNSGDKLYELDQAARASLTAAQLAALDEAVHADARHGFQYRYEAIRVPDGLGDRQASTDILAQFASWLSSPAVLAFLARVTGATDARFADSQATAYGPGDFLTAHSDGVAGKDRRAAYVFSLNPQWRAEWGGLLLFHGADGAVEGVAPGFNTLDLLAVPQPHSVSYVNRAAAGRRYSITGWLRAQPQPG